MEGGATDQVVRPKRLFRVKRRRIGRAIFFDETFPGEYIFQILQAVEPVSDERIAVPERMHADLMRASRLEPKSGEADMSGLVITEHKDTCSRFFPGRMDDPPNVLLIRTPDRPFQGNAFFLKSTVTDAEIELSRRHRRGDKMAVRVFREQQDTARPFVESTDGAQGLN